MSRRSFRTQARARSEGSSSQESTEHPQAGLLHLQRTAGNRATTSFLAARDAAPLAIQRHAASSLLNTFGNGGLTSVIFTPEDGRSVSGSLTFQSGRTHGLSEIGGKGTGQPHRPPGLRNLLLSGGLSRVIFTPDDGSQQLSGDLSFRSGRVNQLRELDVQRHAAPGLTNTFHEGGFSDVVFSPDEGKPMSGDISFQSGRFTSLVEHGAPKPKPAPVKDELLSYSRKSKGDRVREVQRRLNLNGAALLVDGDFGAGTDRAVRSFQRTEGLRPDGVVGPTTLSALRSDRQRRRELNTG